MHIPGYLHSVEQQLEHTMSGRVLCKSFPSYMTSVRFPMVCGASGSLCALYLLPQCWYGLEEVSYKSIVSDLQLRPPVDDPDGS